MRLYKFFFPLCCVLFTLSAQADYRDNNIPNSDHYSSNIQFYYELGIDQKEIHKIEKHPAVKNQLRQDAGYKIRGYGKLSEPTYDPVADYETILPRNSQPDISVFEKIVLTAYLDNPNDIVLVKTLALYHLSQSLIGPHHKGPHHKGPHHKGPHHKGPHHKGPQHIHIPQSPPGKGPHHNGKGPKHPPHASKPPKGPHHSDGEALKHTIIAQYFLHRAQALGAKQKWIKTALNKTDSKLTKIFKRPNGVEWEENHAAHAIFYDAFNYNEERRYIASAALLDDITQQSNNVFTSFLITALNLWVGGEADYDDPTALYNFVLGGYFSTLTIEMARELQEAWFVDPENNTRFRLAPILGGFTSLHKRWLAKLHGDDAAVDLIDQEHREWRLINEPFHAFTVGMAMYEEEENFAESYFAYSRAFSGCDERPDYRTCPDDPIFSFNRIAMILGWVDYFLKTGDFDSAQFFLSLKDVPDFHYSDWDIGRPAWEQRENNLEAIFELYQNDDPSDDPRHFFLKGRKWSTSTSTCQMCHQAQGREWTEEEKSVTTLPPEDVRTISTWPKSGTTWYAAVK